MAVWVGRTGRYAGVEVGDSVRERAVGAEGYSESDFETLPEAPDPVVEPAVVKAKPVKAKPVVVKKPAPAAKKVPKKAKPSKR